MAYSLQVDVIDPDDGQIHVTHTFWGRSEKEVRKRMEGHQQDCAYFSAAVQDERVIEELECIPDEDLPVPEEEGEEEDEDEEGI